MFIEMRKRDGPMLLEKKYEELVSEYHFEVAKNTEDVSSMIRDALTAFMVGCNRPAIWCYGEHTKMLMTDFMNELKDVKFIIDEHTENFSVDSGFQIISSKDIKEYDIDGIVISSFKYRNEIKSVIETEYPSVKYLDLYDYFEKNGVFLRKEYYLCFHPYSKYATINRLKSLLKIENDTVRKEELFWSLIQCMVEIKDFFLAVRYAEEMHEFNDCDRNGRLLAALKEIYEMMLQTARKVDENNVVMLCFDGMRNKDVSKEKMPRFYDFTKRRCYRYTNAYSISTSTYESLIPAYSENLDMQTRYYEKNEVEECCCRFIQKAEQQKRRIYFYTDFAKYVDAEGILRGQSYETATEKLWNFILDASKETNALFYVHILYESHYSYPSPYIDDGFIAEGTNIMFDFLNRNGGKIRTDYIGQHDNSLKYLDDEISPVLECLKCRMFLFADHGNIIFDQQTKLEELMPLHFTYHDNLIHIPFIIKADEMPVGINDENISLIEVNEILICLMEKRKFVRKYPVIVKTQRSAIYNPDFQYLYKKCGQEQGLKAYEAFIFEDKSKLAVYENGYVELVENDIVVEKEEKKRTLFELIKDRVTVCSCDVIQL